MARASESRDGLRKLGSKFYRRDAVDLAQALVGKILVHRVGETERRARVVETEAYVGEHDLASHASKGRTGRTEVMFGRAGRAYVYLIYGVHEMLNVVAGAEGDAQAVLIRAAEPLDGWVADLSGPGKLTRAMGIDRSHNGLELTGEGMYFAEMTGAGARRPRIVRTRRVGVDYAKEWRDELLRFYDGDSAAVSRPRH